MQYRVRDRIYLLTERQREIVLYLWRHGRSTGRQMGLRDDRILRLLWIRGVLLHNLKAESWSLSDFGNQLAAELAPQATS